MKTAYLVVVFAVSLLGADQKAPEMKSGIQKSTVAAASEDTAEILRQTVAKVTAWGEAGRLCAVMLSNDQLQMRDIHLKEKELDARIENVKQDINRLNLTRAQRSQLDYNTEYSKLGNQGSAAQASRNALDGELQKANADANSQQICIDKAKAAIKATIDDPSQSAAASQKKK